MPFGINQNEYFPNSLIVLSNLCHGTFLFPPLQQQKHSEKFEFVLDLFNPNSEAILRELRPLPGFINQWVYLNDRRYTVLMEDKVVKKKTRKKKDKLSIVKRQCIAVSEWKKPKM